MPPRSYRQAWVQRMVGVEGEGEQDVSTSQVAVVVAVRELV